MDRNFTPDFNLQNSVISRALQGEKMPSPSVASMDFIRNFARNFRVCRSDSGIVHDFVLN